MSGAELKNAKRRVRRQVLAARDALAPELRDELARRVIARFVALPEMGAAGTVMAFWSFGSELSTAPLLAKLVAKGVTVALPRIVDGAMEARSWRPGDPMTQTSFGAMEPSQGGFLEPDAVDVIATPAAAFDRRGRRVGYGGGFYDLFFPRTRVDALRAGVGFSLQLLDEDLPAGHFDARVDVVVTEEETVRCRREP